MRHSFRIEPLAALLAGLIVASALPAAAAEPKGQGQIYQQRAADGRIVLTDRPSSTAVTERTWQVDREDTAAAQQRAQDVRKRGRCGERARPARASRRRSAWPPPKQERAWQAQQRDQQMARYDDGLYYPAYAHRPVSEPALPLREHRAAVLRDRHAQEPARQPADEADASLALVGQGQSTSNALKSLTLVKVGPGTTRSPSAAKKP